MKLLKPPNERGTYNFINNTIQRQFFVQIDLESNILNKCNYLIIFVKWSMLQKIEVSLYCSQSVFPSQNFMQ